MLCWILRSTWEKPPRNHQKQRSSFNLVSAVWIVSIENSFENAFRDRENRMNNIHYSAGLRTQKCSPTTRGRSDLVFKTKLHYCIQIGYALVESKQTACNCALQRWLSWARSATAPSASRSPERLSVLHEIDWRTVAPLGSLCVVCQQQPITSKHIGNAWGFCGGFRGSESDPGILRVFLRLPDVGIWSGNFEVLEAASLGQALIRDL